MQEMMLMDRIKEREIKKKLKLNEEDSKVPVGAEDFDERLSAIEEHVMAMRNELRDLCEHSDNAGTVISDAVEKMRKNLGREISFIYATAYPLCMAGWGAGTGSETLVELGLGFFLIAMLARFGASIWEDLKMVD